MAPHRRRRQAAAQQGAVVDVDVPRRELVGALRPECGKDVMLRHSAVLKDRSRRPLRREVVEPALHQLRQRHRLPVDHLAAQEVGYQLGERPLGLTLAASHCPVDVADLSVTAATRESPDQPPTRCALDHCALYQHPLGASVAQCCTTVALTRELYGWYQPCSAHFRWSN